MDALQKNRGWFLALGALMVVLGVIVIGTPAVATLALGKLLGWILVIGGVVQIVHAFKVKEWRGFLFELLGGVLYLLVGLMLVYDPLGGALALTLLLAIFLVVQGVFQVFMAFRVRPARNWSWLLASGIITLILGLLIWSKWPSDALWVVGLLVGIHLISSGWSLIMLALAARSSAGAAEASQSS